MFDASVTRVTRKLAELLREVSIKDAVENTCHLSEEGEPVNRSLLKESTPHLNEPSKQSERVESASISLTNNTGCPSSADTIRAEVPNPTISQMLAIQMTTRKRKRAPSPSPYPKQTKPAPLIGIFRICAFAVVEKEIRSVDTILTTPIDWSAAICINAEDIDRPRLTLQISVAEKPRREKFNITKPHDSMTLTWYGGTLTETGDLMLRDFSYEAWTQWGSKFTEAAQQQQFRRERDFNRHSKKLWTLSCRLSSAEQETFKNAESWKSLPDEVAEHVGKLTAQASSQLVRFWFDPRHLILQNRSLSLFARRVAQIPGVPASMQHRAPISVGLNTTLISRLRDLGESKPIKRSPK